MRYTAVTVLFGALVASCGGGCLHNPLAGHSGAARFQDRVGLGRARPSSNKTLNSRHFFVATQEAAN